MILEVDSYFIDKKQNDNEGDTLERLSQKSFNDSELMNPMYSIEDFYTLFLSIKNADYDITYIHLHKFINKLKLLSYSAILSKDIYSLKFLNISKHYLFI